MSCLVKNDVNDPCFNLGSSLTSYYRKVKIYICLGTCIEDYSSYLSVNFTGSDCNRWIYALHVNNVGNLRRDILAHILKQKSNSNCNYRIRSYNCITVQYPAEFWWMVSSNLRTHGVDSDGWAFLNEGRPFSASTQVLFINTKLDFYSSVVDSTRKFEELKRLHVPRSITKASPCVGQPLYQPHMEKWGF